MKLAREIYSFYVNDCGVLYLIKNYRYRNHEYAIAINIKGKSDTRAQHLSAQREIDDILKGKSA